MCREEKTVAEVGREHAGSRLGHDHAVGAGPFETQDVFGQEAGAFFQQQLDSVGLEQHGGHDLAQIEKPAGQRERSDAAGQHRAVGYGFRSQMRGSQVLGQPAAVECGNGQTFDLVVVADQAAGDRWHLGVAELNGRAERLALDREIHHHGGCSRRIAQGQRLH